MLSSFIITFRETLEAALVVGIILAYLTKIGKRQYAWIVWAGVVGAILASLLGAWAFEQFTGGFTGRAEELFEGIVMMIGATLLTTMIFWMMKRRHAAEKIQHEVAQEVLQRHFYGLFSLVFVSVLREGIETVIFLKALNILTGSSDRVGAWLGISVALMAGYALFIGVRKVPLKKYFTITSMLLILFAAGLMAHGIHELQEAGALSVWTEEVWNINPPVLVEGIYPLMHENGHVGNILKGLFGYNGNPSGLEATSYAVYLAGAWLMWRWIKRPRTALQQVS